jgi:hypothetical protein
LDSIPVYSEGLVILREIAGQLLGLLVRLKQPLQGKRKEALRRLHFDITENNGRWVNGI